MKKIIALLFVLLLSGCGGAEESVSVQPLAEPSTVAETVAQTVAVETTPETTIPEETVPEETVPEETVPEDPKVRNAFYPTRRIWSGREVYDFGMELYNDTESALTVTAMHVTDYSAGEEVSSKVYTGNGMEPFSGDRPAQYTMEPGYPIVLFMEEPVGNVTFDTREITVTLQSREGTETERFFRFEVNDELSAQNPDPEEADWNPAFLKGQTRRFPCVVTNDTDQVLTLKGVYSIQYVGSNPIRCSYRMPGGSYNSVVLELIPGQTAVWNDDIMDNNVFATHRKYVLYYEDPQGNVYEKSFRFKVDRENDHTVIPMITYGLIPESSGAPEYTDQEIQEMIDNNLSLEEVAEKISTIADLAQYLQLKGYDQDPRGDLKFQHDGTQWHTNRSASVVFADNKGNCGGGSNLANDILRGDYEKQGYIQYAGNRGGHIFNYFYRDGYYYIMDLTVLLNWTPVAVVKELSDFTQGYISQNRNQYMESENNYIRLLYAYERDGAAHTPVAGIPLTIVGDDVRDSLQVLYQEEGYEPVFLPTPPVESLPGDAQ